MDEFILIDEYFGQSNSYKKLTTFPLRQKLSALGLNDRGKRPELVSRLEQYYQTLTIDPSKSEWLEGDFCGSRPMAGYSSGVTMDIMWDAIQSLTQTVNELCTQMRSRDISSSSSASSLSDSTFTKPLNISTPTSTDSPTTPILIPSPITPTPVTATPKNQPIPPNTGFTWVHQTRTRNAKSITTKPNTIKLANRFSNLQPDIHLDEQQQFYVHLHKYSQPGVVQHQERKQQLPYTNVSSGSGTHTGKQNVKYVASGSGTHTGDNQNAKYVARSGSGVHTGEDKNAKYVARSGSGVHTGENQNAMFGNVHTGENQNVHTGENQNAKFENVAVAMNGSGNGVHVENVVVAMSGSGNGVHVENVVVPMSGSGNGVHVENVPKKTLILSDSSCRNIKTRNVNTLIDRKKEEMIVSQHPGANTEQLHHYMGYWTKQHRLEKIVIFAGTNDLLYENSKARRENRSVRNEHDLVNRVLDMAVDAKKAGVKYVYVGGLYNIENVDNIHVSNYNQLLQMGCINNDIYYINNSNIGPGDLYDGLHVNNGSGHRKLKQNIMQHMESYRNYR